MEWYLIAAVAGLLRLDFLELFGGWVKDLRDIDDYCMMGNLKRLLGGLLMALAVAATFALSAQPASINDGLVAYYPFDANADDESGNSNDGTIERPQWTPDRFGIEDASLHTGEARGGDVLVSGSDLPLGSTPRTFSVWIKPDARSLNLGETLRGDIFSYGRGTGKNGKVTMPFIFSTNPFVITLVLGSDSFHWEKVLVGWSFEDWHQVAWVYYGNSSADLFVDGVLMAPSIWHIPGEQTTELSLNTEPGPLVIGSFANHHFEGAIDDLRIYDRSLSPKEIAELHAYEKTLMQPGGEGGGELRDRYRLILGDFTWDEAREDAERRGGYLATVTSEQEQNDISHVVRPPASYWLGATDAHYEGVWQWETGEWFSFENWGRRT